MRKYCTGTLHIITKLRNNAREKFKKALCRNVDGGLFSALKFAV